MINKILYYLKHPEFILLRLDNKSIIRLSDKLYLKLLFKERVGYKLDLKNPKTFNEKLQWLKLYNKKEIYTTMVDKYEVKKYVSSIIGEKYIIPTIGVYDTFDEIDLESLPDKFVIKCTHDSGGLVIVKNKKNLDINYVKNKINKCLKKNYYFSSREWPYKNVKPKIIVEKYMENNNNELIDYKLFCFKGIPKIILVCSERFSSNNMCETWFDDKWNLLDIVENGHRIDENVLFPKNFEKMKLFASKLSNNTPFLRVDFYEIDGKLYFGELTFYPSAGFEKFQPEEWNRKLGDLINLPLDK